MALDVATLGRGTALRALDGGMPRVHVTRRSGLREGPAPIATVDRVGDGDDDVSGWRRAGCRSRVAGGDVLPGTEAFWAAAMGALHHESLRVASAGAAALPRGRGAR